MEHVDVLIVGAGISGIGAACHLRRELPDKTFTILEGRASLGGTWDLFRYPGIRSDSDMYTFGYAFKPWVEDQDIATGDAILRYLNETVDEYALRDTMRFNHRVEAVRWSSTERRWTATVRQADGETVEISAQFLLGGTGYYNYDKGYRPDFLGLDEAFQGVVADPQHWPEDLDYTNKRVLVIGSGATAVTVVPSMAEKAAHVTMLQRSPTYIFSRPGEDVVAKRLRTFLPDRAAHELTRVKNVAIGTAMYRFARRAPDRVRGFLRDKAIEALGPDVDVDVHFNPRYNPWDQRLCLIPDGDLYEALRVGDASIVTDTIAHFDETGAVLESGERIDADIVVPATGLALQFLGGMTMEVDGRPIDSSELITYRGMMFSGIPNFVAVIGYTNASWTLKADLTSTLFCRMLRQMDAAGFDTLTPRDDIAHGQTRPIMAGLTSGYVKRGSAEMPKQALAHPWTNSDNYLRDVVETKRWSIRDEALTLTKTPSAARPKRFSFRGKTALVTGAASGIGRALAEALSARGTHLVLVDVQATALEEVAGAARRAGVNVATHVVDMGDREGVEQFGAQLADEHPELDLLINNAGVALGGRVDEVSPQDLDWLMNINFFGVATLTRALLPQLRRRPDAHVANVSSVFGLIAPPGQAAYCASKFAVRGWSEALRRELVDTTVGVSVIHPGGVKTSIAKNARLAVAVDPAALEESIREVEKSFITTPADAAKQILHGIERRRARILVGPDARVIEWLERLLPTRNLEVLSRVLGWKETRPRAASTSGAETAPSRPADRAPRPS
ncbi:MAG: SDR family NAD(P)-dependent oxidoreductase [Sandaracinaceae bacterium]